MNHCFQPINLDCLVESSWLCNILYDLKIELRLWCVGVRGADLLCLFFRTDCRRYGMAMLQQDIENVCGNEATSTC